MGVILRTEVLVEDGRQVLILFVDKDGLDHCRELVVRKPPQALIHFGLAGNASAYDEVGRFARPAVRVVGRWSQELGELLLHLIGQGIGKILLEPVEHLNLMYLLRYGDARRAPWFGQAEIPLEKCRIFNLPAQFLTIFFVESEPFHWVCDVSFLADWSVLVEKEQAAVAVSGLGGKVLGTLVKLPGYSGGLLVGKRDPIRAGNVLALIVMFLQLVAARLQLGHFLCPLAGRSSDYGEMEPDCKQDQNCGDEPQAEFSDDFHGFRLPTLPCKIHYAAAGRFLLGG